MRIRADAFRPPRLQINFYHYHAIYVLACTRHAIYKSWSKRRWLESFKFHAPLNITNACLVMIYLSQLILAMFSFSFILSLFSATTALALSHNVARSDSWPSPESCSGNCTGVHDPALIRRESDGKWFRLSTSGNIAIASADDITGPWTYDGPMLANGSIIQLPIDAQDLWVLSVCHLERHRL